MCLSLTPLRVWQECGIIPYHTRKHQSDNMRLNKHVFFFEEYSLSRIVPIKDSRWIQRSFLVFNCFFFSYKVFLTRLLNLWAIIVNEYHMYVLINPAPSNTNIDSVFVTIPPTTYIFGALILRFLFLFHFSVHCFSCCFSIQSFGLLLLFFESFFCVFFKEGLLILLLFLNSHSKCLNYSINYLYVRN